MSTQATKVSTLLREEVLKVPQPIRKAFQNEIGAITSRVDETLSASNDNIEVVIRLVVDNWIFDFLTSKNHTEYKNLIKELGTSPLTIEEFRGGPCKPDPRAQTPWKRFVLIRNNGFKIGDKVYDSTGEGYEISGITRNMMLQLKGYKGGEPQNPINFTKKK